MLAFGGGILNFGEFPHASKRELTIYKKKSYGGNVDFILQGLQHEGTGLCVTSACPCPSSSQLTMQFLKQ